MHYADEHKWKCFFKYKNIRYYNFIVYFVNEYVIEDDSLNSPGTLAVYILVGKYIGKKLELVVLKKDSALEVHSGNYSIGFKCQTETDTGF